MYKALHVFLRGATVAVLAFSLTGISSALAHPGDDGQHGPLEGHLLGSDAWGKIELVGELTVSDAKEGLMADVAVDPDGDYAYLARWGGAECAGPEGNGVDGGVYVIRISDLSHPEEVGFIRTHQDTLVGEGMQVIDVTTRYFSGEILAINHELCGKNGKGGFSLWDVTDPLNPIKLTENFGDFPRGAGHDGHQYHSVFVWNAGNRAYLVATDDEEALDVDIYDITNPKKPILISELDLNDFGVSQPEMGLTDSFLHDMVVKQIDGHWIMLLSYWDGSWVVLNVDDPANPVFVGDTDYGGVDPEVLVATGISVTPEGNAHQAEFTIDNQFIIGTDEDFDPYRLAITFEDGTFRANAGTNTTVEDAEAISGTPIFVGRACPDDAAVPSAPDLPDDEIAVDPQEPSLAYLSYYSGGLRAIQIQCANPADTSTCELVEVGGYLHGAGNNSWGVETFVGDDGFTYILASDRDSGLWIFRDP